LSSFFAVVFAIMSVAPIAPATGFVQQVVEAEQLVQEGQPADQMQMPEVVYATAPIEGDDIAVDGTQALSESGQVMYVAPQVVEQQQVHYVIQGAEQQQQVQYLLPQQPQYAVPHSVPMEPVADQVVTAISTPAVSSPTAVSSPSRVAVPPEVFAKLLGGGSLSPQEMANLTGQRPPETVTATAVVDASAVVAGVATSAGEAIDNAAVLDAKGAIVDEVGVATSPKKDKKSLKTSNKKSKGCC
jgi:hypothetical protein